MGPFAFFGAKITSHMDDLYSNNNTEIHPKENIWLTKINISFHHEINVQLILTYWSFEMIILSILCEYLLKYESWKCQQNFEDENVAWMKK